MMYYYYYRVTARHDRAQISIISNALQVVNTIPAYLHPLYLRNPASTASIVGGARPIHQTGGRS